jgi:hypothetical protein
MRLNPTLVDRTLAQIQAVVLPDDHPAIPQLNRLYGDHTFFVDTNGLNIIEPTDNTLPEGIQEAAVVNLASWNNADDPPSLTAHEPEPTDVVVVLGSKN